MNKISAIRTNPQFYKIPPKLNAVKSEEEIGCVSKGNKVKPIFDKPVKNSYSSVINLIKNAKTEIQVENFLITNTQIADELVSAAKRGVEVKVISGPFGITTESVSEFINIYKIRRYLKANGIKIINYNLDLLKDKFFKIDHVKILIVDEKKAWIGGMCWTADLKQNHDVGVEILGPAAGDLKKLFDDAWRDSSGHKTAPKVPATIAQNETKEDYLPEEAEIRVVSTDGKHADIKKIIMKNIDSAKSEILVELLTFNDEDIINALILAKLRGVNIRILLDPANYAFGAPNKLSAWKLQKFGIPVRFYNTDRSKEELMHSKIGIFDGDTTILGSANWTKGSLQYYHEMDVEIKNKMLAESFTEMFEKDWENSRNVQPPTKFEKFLVNALNKVTDIFAVSKG